MSLPPHPSAELEQEHLRWTLERVQAEYDRCEQDTAQKLALVEREVIHSGGMLSSDLIVTKQLAAASQRALHNLRLAQNKPYFTRVDFRKDSETDERVYYIGKWGVWEALQPIVIDWRAPAANLYYAGQLGPVAYNAPDGEIRGHLSLKRQFSIQNGTLETIFDTDVAAQDAYLMGVLGEMRGTRLRDIVTTIQAEQNVVIRHPLNKPLVVQGVAGSGKTTIALHRIAYLLDTHRDTLRPAQLTIVAPNPLFLDYISQVLPDLGVEEVEQTTFPRLCARLLGKACPQMDENDRLENMLTLPQDERMRETERLHFMGSLRFLALVEDFIVRYLDAYVPDGDLTLGGATLYTHAEMRTIFLTELAPFPVERRLLEMKKYWKRRLKAVETSFSHGLTEACEARVALLATRMPDSEERRARMTKLYDSRDKRLEELAALSKGFEKTTLSQYEKPNLASLYQRFLADAHPTATDSERALFQTIRARKRLGTEDLPALCVLSKTLFGWATSDTRHMVVDEAQDLSPFAVWLMRTLVTSDAMTLVGDLAQGVRSFEGLTSWDEILSPIFLGRATFAPLLTSYRSTVEIITFAGRIAARYPAPGSFPAKPVLRHGEEPDVQAFEDKKALWQALTRQVEDVKQDGCQTIALVTRTAKAAAVLHKAISPTLPARLLTNTDTQYTGGVLVLPASLVKGLEFDAVFVTDSEVYQDTPEDLRLLYVCCTRPLHRLFVWGTGDSFEVPVQIGAVAYGDGGDAQLG